MTKREWEMKIINNNQNRNGNELQRIRLIEIRGLPIQKIKKDTNTEELEH